ncbi:hypothetical protein CH63R_02218 [Colletotrichum higginsianum IMI 349063]|uniref:Uncharacterized protein n=1 Tax=Colletotrichum higginsianum (strain IMI 349063) TaxID=759273 RepID=A0A1B7YNI3_COLHI|nr:hypothetical protein CH63R_02218 [Colletotrichum higginsianum IMI 349063]OBR13492.1 hypothetical protein CH63R_02218 [Colletotrichum higginsianum IMI 349063]
MARGGNESEVFINGPLPKRGTDSGPRLTGLEQGLCKQGTACFIRLFTRTRFGRIKEVRGQLVSAKPDEETG